MANIKEVPRAILHKASGVAREAVRSVADNPGAIAAFGGFGLVVGMADVGVTSNYVIEGELNKVYPAISQSELSGAQQEITVFDRWVGLQIEQGQTTLDINTVVSDDPTYAQRLKKAHEIIAAANVRAEYRKGLIDDVFKDNLGEFNRSFAEMAGGILVFFAGVARNAQMVGTGRRNAPSHSNGAT